jgi:hypothetical protein
MSDRTRPDVDAHQRDRMRRWLDDWAHVGRVLEAERWARLRTLTDDQAWNEAVGLLSAWEPDAAGDAGEGLLLVRDVFARWPAAKR